MSDYAIIFQVLAALVVVFFFVLTYLNTKTWQWLHVTAMFLVFAAGFTFCVYAAMTLKTRAKWVKDHDDLEKRLATTNEELQRVSHGDPIDIDGKTPSVYSVREELARTVLDRGRVWRGCQPSVRARPITVLTSDPAATPAKKHNIAAKTIVHVFREAAFQPDPNDPTKVTVPAAYIGEFQADPVNDQTVALAETMPLSQEQMEAGQVPGTWALYEVAPADGHQWFAAEKEEDRIAPLAAAAGLAAQTERLQLSPQAVQRFTDLYKFDGKDLKDIPNANSLPPENVWVEVKFTQEYEVTVDAPVVASLDAEPFNSEGQAVLEALRRGGANPDEAGKVKFGPAEGQIQTAVIDRQTAQSLIDRGIATLVREIYRRPLNDYERKFRAINNRSAEIDSRLRQLDLDNKSMIAATEKAKEQQAAIEELKGKINDDLAKVKYEVAELKKYTGALGDRLTAAQTELSQLYVSNKALARELARLTVEITEQADRRGREATASLP